MYKAKELIFTFALVLFFVSNYFAQDLSQSNMNFEFDYAQFKYDSTSNLLEFYIFIDKSSLAFENRTKNIALSLNIKIDDNVNDNMIIDKTYALDDVYDESVIGSRVIISTLKFGVPFGEYSLKVSIEDKNDSTNHKSMEDTLQIVNFLDNELYVSGIELASNIISNSDKKNSVFYKNGMEVIPNPTSYYNQKPVMFYYAELYFNDLKEGDKITLERTILDNYGRVVNRKTRKIQSSINNLVEADVINLTKFSTGGYLMVLSLIDSTASVYNQSQKKFYLLNPLDSTEVANTEAPGYLASEYAAMSEEECDLEYTAIKYIASKNEKDAYEKLTNVEVKRKFLYNFWKARDYDLTTSINEYKLDYLQRAEVAREKYTVLNKDGVRTDRGRVYLLYGKPDDIEYHDNENQIKPYEIWTYNSIEGGVYFIFGDVTGYHDYQLLHSTKRGEIKDARWRTRLDEAY